MKRTSGIAAVCLSLALSSTPAFGREGRSSSELRVTGRSTLHLEPETARIDIGVVTEAPDADGAARENAQKLDAVLSALREALGPATKIETLGYSVQPRYRRPAPREETVLVGYTVSNVVRVRELGLSDVGKVIDTATGAGANQVRNIDFRLADEAAAKLDALREAARDARRKADALASALGVRVARILSVQEGEPSVVRPTPQAFEMARMAQAAEPATPIEAGTIEVHASVTLVVEIEE